MGNLPDYKCTQCGADTARDELVAVKVSFGTLGSDSIMLKSRTVAWLCPRCTKMHPAWQLEEYESPGFRQAEEVAAMARTVRAYNRLASGQPAETPPDGTPSVSSSSDNS